MTAEIAVINRLAVALAADSAVTITKGSDAKVFPSDNKIFELSRRHPIALRYEWRTFGVASEEAGQHDDERTAERRGAANVPRGGVVSSKSGKGQASSPSNGKRKR